MDGWTVERQIAFVRKLGGCGAGVKPTKPAEPPRARARRLATFGTFQAGQKIGCGASRRRFFDSRTARACARWAANLANLGQATERSEAARTDRAVPGRGPRGHGVYFFLLVDFLAELLLLVVPDFVADFFVPPDLVGMTLSFRRCITYEARVLFLRPSPTFFVPLLFSTNKSDT